MLGKGGFGIVYEGQWQANIVAVKQILMSNPPANVLQEFEKEGELWWHLNHMNIARLFGICKDPNHLALVMEYFPLGSLYNVIHNKAELL
jgi:serine/threonine protein kinase